MTCINSRRSTERFHPRPWRRLSGTSGAGFAEIEHETRLPEVRGRADMLFGATVIELMSDLRRERADVEARLPDYLAEREQRTGRRYLGLATDGASFLAFERRDGRLVEIGRHETGAEEPQALLAWLEPALSDRDDLVPDPLRVRRELGRDSLTWARARALLEPLWARLRDHPEVEVKRGLWDGLLREAYGAEVGDDGRARHGPASHPHLTRASCMSSIEICS